MSKPGDTKYIQTNVYHLRKHILKMSQEEFSEKVGLSKDTISNIERGRYLPSVANLVSISNETDCPVDFFLHRLEE